MGVTLCKKHGDTGITLACPHVHRAWGAGEPFAFSWIDVGWGHTAVCAPCAATMPPTEAPDDGLLVWSFSLELRPACGACFTEWEAAHGRSAG